MRMIFPEGGGELDLIGLADAYAYPRERWLRANFVASADGAAWMDGRSAGLSSPDDKHLFGLLRVLADVVLVGAGTVRIEEYKAARPRPSLAALRDGRPQVPAIAVVTRSLALDLSAPLFTAAPPDARTIVITCEACDPGRRAAARQVADVIVTGGQSVDLGQAMDALAGRGLRRVLCEGGPHLLGGVAASGLLDELSLSVSPTLAGPGAGRIISGPLGPARPLTLKHVLADDDGFLFCRYVAGDQGKGY